MPRRYRVINLGQTTSRADELVADYNKIISRYEDLAKQLSEAPKMAALRKAVDCKELAEEMRQIPEGALSDAIPVMDKCVQEIKDIIDKEIARLQASGAPVPAGASTIVATPSGSSNLLYAAGAAAAIGAGVLLLV